MFITLFPLVLLVPAVLTAADKYNRRRCAFGDPCWPDAPTWRAFNDSMSGRLIQSVPSAAVCHEKNFDEGLCKVAKTEWKNSFWRTNQTGAYSAIIWELGSDQCFIESPKSAPCQPGLGVFSLCVVSVADTYQSTSLFGGCSERRRYSESSQLREQEGPLPGCEKHRS